MYEKQDKSKEKKSKVIPDTVAQKNSNAMQGFWFVNNRPESITQRKCQDVTNSSPQVNHAVQLQAMTRNHFSQLKPFIQKKVSNTGLPINLNSKKGSGLSF